MRLYFGLLLLFNVLVYFAQCMVSIDIIDIEYAWKCNLVWSVLYTAVYVGMWCIAPYMS